MKKLFSVSVLVLSAVFTLNTQAATPVAPTAVNVADASVVCVNPEDSKTAKAVGPNARVTASCGQPTKHRGSSIKKTSSVSTSTKKVVSETSVVIAPITASIATRFPEEGKVYSDAGGNTFERHKGGSRECKFYVNGRWVKSMFVQHPDPVESKRQCDLLSQEFYSTMSNVTPEEETIYTVPSVSSVSAKKQTSSVSDGDLTCELKYNSKVVETKKVSDDNACKSWTLAKAKENGWISKN